MISSLDDLQRLLKLCRKQGVLEIELQGVKLKLGDLPDKQEKEIEDPNKAINDLVGLEPGFEDIDPMAFYSQPRADQ